MVQPRDAAVFWATSVSWQVETLRAELEKLLSHVMPEACIHEWLRELIEGRYFPLSQPLIDSKEQLV